MPGDREQAMLGAGASACARPLCITQFKRRRRAPPLPPQQLDQNKGTGWDVAALSDDDPYYAGSCGRCYEGARC